MMQCLNAQVEKCLKSKLETLAYYLREMPNLSASKQRIGGKYFLGIRIRKFSLTQTALIEKVLKLTGMSDANEIQTPTTGAPVRVDLDRLDFKECWEYSSIVGMLMYLATNMQAYLEYAIHRAARFTTDLSTLVLW